MHSPLTQKPNPHTESLSGKQLRVRGQVQGVGFRPTVWRIAGELGLNGHVLNDGEGVLIRLFGTETNMTNFISQLMQHCPPLARIDAIEEKTLSFETVDGFHIASSQATQANTRITPDAATCAECLADINDPDNRRYGYAFTNCTHCGPRLSIVQAIPYDRANTSMASFKQCTHCHTEYKAPANRRFHAQPNACADCGPQLWLQSKTQTAHNNVIEQAAEQIRAGKILALKGIGGFHLVCDATNEQAVLALRTRKHRPNKALALMARNLEQIRNYASVNKDEAALLQSSAAPIVLLDTLAENKTNSTLASSIAPGLKSLGFMLPYSPLHHLLLAAIDRPIVATSGNSSGLPPCIKNEQALQQLDNVADVFLLHDRPVVNRVDDSIVRVIDNNTQMLRRARGYAPASIKLPPEFAQAAPILALGGELKNTFCLLHHGEAVVSQHMGDLENLQTFEDYLHNISLYQQLFQFTPERLAIDLHPEYLSSKHGKDLSQDQQISLSYIQHHHAHIASCMADNQWPLDAGKVIGIALDGIGYGDDNTLWGAEILLADYREYKRLAHLNPTALPGGHQAMRQPWRNLIAQLHHSFGKDWQQQIKPVIAHLHKRPCTTVQQMIEQNINCPPASSAGRLFDAVAAALGICSQQIDYEGQAAIELEALARPNYKALDNGAYTLSIHYQNGAPCRIDTATLWPELLADIEHGVSKNNISERFHAGLAQAFANVATHYAQQYSIQHIALSGGVMQNRLLCRLINHELKDAGLDVLIHQQIPANDGGLSLGQAVIAAAQSIGGGTQSCV